MNEAEFVHDTYYAYYEDKATCVCCGKITPIHLTNPNLKGLPLLMFRIESFLSARLFLRPQLVNDRIFFESNLSGRISLYVMDYGGSVPEPLLPPDIALQNPHLLPGYPFYVFPTLNKILVMIDKDGDENYQPMIIPLDGGYPEPAFGERFFDYRVHLVSCDPEHNIIYFDVESRIEQLHFPYMGNLETGELVKLGESMWGSYVDGVKDDHSHVIMIDGYTVGDSVAYLWSKDNPRRERIIGIPIEERRPKDEVPLNSLGDFNFTSEGNLVFFTSLFSDTYGIGYTRLSNPQEIRPVEVEGIVHQGSGEFERLRHLTENRFALQYNIDGCSWLYEASFSEKDLKMRIDAVICGQGELSNGVIEGFYYDKSGDRFALSFSTATRPTQIYTVEGKDRSKRMRHTREKVLSISENYLSAGEDASFTSFDGLRISARLYLPSEPLGYQPPYPVVYYVHGGPHSQERPDFAWFSMPLIQFLTMKGFAVFVPNVRGSTGYGLNYTKWVDRDWGGKDRLDHVYALQEVLSHDKRLDVSKTGVVGRSYGGYMTLMLAGRHPELWSAAVDMFGPYDLLTFMERIPETWKPYFAIAVGNPEKDKEFLIERSPRTYIENISCPLLVIQGKNDPRVVEKESAELVQRFNNIGKKVEYLMFENEGHDVLKFENRVTCYNAITNFFERHLKFSQ